MNKLLGNNIIDRLKRFFTRVPKPTGYIYRADRHTGWGNTINFRSKEEKPGQYSLNDNPNLLRKLQAK